MANVKTSDETAASALDGSELVRIVQGGADRRTTTQDIADLGGGGGGLSLVSTQVASSSASLAFTGLDSSSTKYLLVLSALVPASDDTLIAEFGTGAGPTYQTTNYRYLQEFSSAFTGVRAENHSEAGTSMLLGTLAAAGQMSGQYYLLGASMFGSQYQLASDGHDYRSNIGARWTGGASFTAVRLRLSGGANIASGSASLYALG